jgi:hypothetical protein
MLSCPATPARRSNQAVVSGQAQHHDEHLLAAVVGLFLAAGIAFLIDYLDDTVKAPEDLEANGLPSLGGVARFRRPKDPVENLIASSASRRHFSEAYRVIRTNVQFSNHRPTTLLVTSAKPARARARRRPTCGEAWQAEGHPGRPDLRRSSISPAQQWAGLTNLAAAIGIERLCAKDPLPEPIGAHQRTAAAEPVGAAGVAPA